MIWISVNSCRSICKGLWTFENKLFKCVCLFIKLLIISTFGEFEGDRKMQSNCLTPHNV